MKNRIEEIRKEKGISQEAFAKAMQVSRQTIRSLENGRYNPSILLAYKIAKYFGMSIEDVFIFELSSSQHLGISSTVRQYLMQWSTVIR